MKKPYKRRFSLEELRGLSTTKEVWSWMLGERIWMLDAYPSQLLIKETHEKENHTL